MDCAVITCRDDPTIAYIVGITSGGLIAMGGIIAIMVKSRNPVFEYSKQDRRTQMVRIVRVTQSQLISRLGCLVWLPA